MEEDGSLTVAKFPSRKDDYDVALWEHLCHLLARKAGINVADTRVIPGEEYHILLSRRFDRLNDRRVHFASAMTLLGLADGDNATNGYGYPNIADFIMRHDCDVEDNLEELYRRVAFNIIVGNSDDHFRNHGFLLNRKGWSLSPAYDINPTTDDYQSLLINSNTNEANPDILLQSSEEYMIPNKRAAAIIDEVKAAMRNWRKAAVAIGISQRDINAFAPRIDKWL